MRLSKSVYLEQKKLAATPQTMIIDSVCLEDEIMLQPFTDFKASGYLEHFFPCSYWMLLYCNEGYSVLAKSAATHFSTVRRKKWQQMFALDIKCWLPFCRNSFPEGQGWNIYILKNANKVEIHSSNQPDPFCDSKQSHQTCKINESGVHTV